MKDTVSKSNGRNGDAKWIERICKLFLSLEARTKSWAFTVYYIWCVWKSTLAIKGAHKLQSLIVSWLRCCAGGRENAPAKRQFWVRAAETCPCLLLKHCFCISMAEVHELMPVFPWIWFYFSYLHVGVIQSVVALAFRIKYGNCNVIEWRNSNHFVTSFVKKYTFEDCFYWKFLGTKY